ncbi:hypothetical protein NC652_013337 [Populus alba x Populus x berolinensis]|nr:hypothetical protein NC652_013337 [Populus alba x Populus x berolinensis]
MPWHVNLLLTTSLMLCRMLLKDMAELIFWLTMLGFNVLAHLLRSLYQLRKTLSIPMFLVL